MSYLEYIFIYFEREIGVWLNIENTSCGVNELDGVGYWSNQLLLDRLLIKRVGLSAESSL